MLLAIDAASSSDASLLPVEAAHAADHFTTWCRYLRTASAIQFFTLHGVIGITWTSIWLCRPAPTGDYFSQMDQLRQWVLRANGLRYNLRLAVSLGALFVVLLAVALPFFLGASMSAVARRSTLVARPALSHGWHSSLGPQ